VSIVLDDDFQSYAIGQHTPYGLIEGIGVNPATIVAGGIFSDSQSVSVPAVQTLEWPTTVHTPFDTYFQQATIICGLQITTLGVSSNGELWQLRASHADGIGDTAVLTLKVMADGCLAFTNENQLFVFKISDFSLLSNQWYWLQINVSFSAISGTLVYTCDVAINGQVVLSVVDNNTFLPITNYPTAGFNYWINGGCGNGNLLARLTMYDTIQPIGTSPHPGATPAARINQGLIELILTAQPSGPGTGPQVACPFGGGVATVGIFYSKTVTSSGGIPPVTYAITGGSLPPGLTLNPVTGTISGIPTTPGTYNYTCTGTDASTNTGTPASCQIVVGALLQIALMFSGVIRYLVKDSSSKAVN
jgi:Putative Ig domain